MKRTVNRFWALCILAVLFLVGCSPSQSPEKATAGYLDAFFALDAEKANSYLESAADFSGVSKEDAAFQWVEAVLAKTTVDTVAVTEESEDKATVNVSLTGPNVESIYEKAMDTVFEIYFTNTEIDEKALNENMAASIIENLEDQDYIPIQKTMDLSLIKEEDQWVLTKEAEKLCTETILGNLSTVNIKAE